jgi:hypothetical protein
MRAKDFVETISGYEVEKLLKDAIVKHCRFFYVQIKDVRYPSYNAGADIISQVRQFLPDSRENIRKTVFSRYCRFSGKSIDTTMER